MTFLQSASTLNNPSYSLGMADTIHEIKSILSVILDPLRVQKNFIQLNVQQDILSKQKNKNIRRTSFHWITTS